MSEWNYIYGAFGITWVVLIGYAVQVSRAARRAERDYETATRGTRSAR